MSELPTNKTNFRIGKRGYPISHFFCLSVRPSVRHRERKEKTKSELPTNKTNFRIGKRGYSIITHFIRPSVRLSERKKRLSLSIRLTRQYFSYFRSEATLLHLTLSVSLFVTGGNVF